MSVRHIYNSFGQIITPCMICFRKVISVTCESANAFVSVGRGGVSSDPQRLLVRAHCGSEKVRSIALFPRVPQEHRPAYSICMLAERG